MLEFFTDFAPAIATTFAHIPAPVAAALIFTAAILVALGLHAIAVRIGRRLILWRPVARKVLKQIKGPLRLAFILMALRVATGLAPLSSDTADIWGQALQVALTILFGWIALIATDIAADLYLRRFRLDVGDNLLARKHVTQVRVLKGAANTLILLVTCGAALMNFETARQIGVSLFASAGIAGIVVGFAARPLLSSLIAGVQIAVTQPIRIDDALLVEGEWGRIEEITATYVVVKLWDWRRLIVPLSYFMEKPFQNWTRHSASLIGSVFLYVDYSVPVERLRAKLHEILKSSPLWDGDVVSLQMTETKERSVELRALMSARSSSDAFDLRCDVRERLIGFLQTEYPAALPRDRREELQFAGESKTDEHGPKADFSPLSSRKKIRDPGG